MLKTLYYPSVLIDMVILTCVYFLPAFSHIIPIPLYLLDPMRILLLLGFILSNNKTNGYILALTIPLFSSFVIGHPPFFKAILIAVELFVNLLIFVHFLKSTKINIGLSMFISIAVSKVVYYLLKFLFIKTTLVDGDLVTTNLYIQLVTTVLIAFVFNFIWLKTKRGND